jgi:2,4-dienoyl-CoA reductase (NADPH2)
MPKHKSPMSGRYSHAPDTPERLVALCGEQRVELPSSGNISVLADPLTVCGFVLPNRLAVHPMEGCDGAADGRPDALAIRRYERFAAGGAGLIWFEATAVVPEGRANPRQLWIHEGNVRGFAAVVERIREKARERFGPEFRPLVVAQLTHSGRYSKPVDKPVPLIAHHDPNRDGAMNLPPDHPLVTDEYLDRLQDRYVQAAQLAFRAGFDAVDIKCCHGYLLHELLSGHLREGKFGGRFENRTRMLREIVEKVRSVSGKMVTARLGIFDAIPYPHGWGVSCEDPMDADLTEPARLIGRLRELGVGMVNVTLGNPYYNPFFNRPFDKPVLGAPPPPEHPVVGVARLIGLCGILQKQHPGVAMIGTGYSWLRTLFGRVAAGAVEQGFARVVGVGRQAFAYPDFAADLLEKGKLDPKKICVACSGCTQIMRDGGRTGCIVRDAEVYGPIYRAGRAKT